MKGQIPDSIYNHDPDIKDNEGHTVCYYLFNNEINIPERWKDE